jgi:transposase
MARAYPGDFRERVLEARRAGASAGEIARILGVSHRTIYRWEAQYRVTGSVEPRSAPGRAPAIGGDQVALLVAQVTDHADATLAEHCAYWAETTGRRVGTSTMWRMVRKLGLPRKKRV